MHLPTHLSADQIQSLLPPAMAHRFAVRDADDDGAGLARRSFLKLATASGFAQRARVRLAE